MKAATVTIKGLRCDAPSCGYHQQEPISDKYEEWQKWLNKPCPKCGANLLTQADLDAVKNIFAVADKVNSVLGPILDLLPIKEPQKMVAYDLGMDGSGKIHPTKLGNEWPFCKTCQSYHPVDQKCMEPRRNW